MTGNPVTLITPTCGPDTPMAEEYNRSWLKVATHQRLLGLGLLLLLLDLLSPIRCACCAGCDLLLLLCWHLLLSVECGRVESCRDINVDEVPRFSAVGNPRVHHNTQGGCRCCRRPSSRNQARAGAAAEMKEATKVKEEAAATGAEAPTGSEQAAIVLDTQMASSRTCHKGWQNFDGCFLEDSLFPAGHDNCGALAGPCCCIVRTLPTATWRAGTQAACRLLKSLYGLCSECDMGRKCE